MERGARTVTVYYIKARVCLAQPYDRYAAFHTLKNTLAYCRLLAVCLPAPPPCQAVASKKGAPPSATRPQQVARP